MPVHVDKTPKPPAPDPRVDQALANRAANTGFVAGGMVGGIAATLVCVAFCGGLGLLFLGPIGALVGVLIGLWLGVPGGVLLGSLLGAASGTVATTGGRRMVARQWGIVAEDGNRIPVSPGQRTLLTVLGVAVVVALAFNLVYPRL